MKISEDYKMIRSFLKEQKVKNHYVPDVGIVTVPKYSSDETYTFEVYDDPALLVCTALLHRRATSAEIPKMTDFANRLNGHLAAVRAHVDAKNGEFKLNHSTYFLKDDLSHADIRQCWDHLQWVINVYGQSFDFVYSDEWTAEEEVANMAELLAEGYGQSAD
ncbi:hypothetical protein OVA24_17460 [Luteolibacter sp. SL250]|uniref:hypothetical protein n=1 Tax=Luteolibacter sp. SL250 TaxID=2995170 RepID=UPI00226F5712|nr:hypothetical protein [Luteolibacter sp. SL250]WAC19020.1 hypothetical protein OVA24_17460 [Luteolibacter sp. SL250]